MKCNNVSYFEGKRYITNEIPSSQGGEYKDGDGSIALIMEAPSSSETSLNFYEFKWSNKQKDSYFYKLQVF
jgi:hypothetical protein